MSRARGVVAGVQRRWWLTALLVLLVTVGSLVQYFGPGAAQHEIYIATRSFRVVVIPVGASTAYDGYVASRREDEITDALATGGLLSSSQLDDAIAARVRLDHIASPLTARDIAAALSATHSGNLVTLTARRHATAEADAVAAAAVETLSSTMVFALLPSTLRPALEETLLLQMEGSASQPTRDTTQSEAAVGQVLARVGLALVAGILLTVLVGWWMSVRPRAPRLT